MNATAIRAHFDGASPAGQWAMPDMSILTGGRTTPPVMPKGVFGSLWPLVSDLASGAGAPVDYVATSVLGVAASLIGAKRRVQPYATSSWSEPCILWMAVVGDPSSNKSPAIDAGTSPLRAMEADHAEAHKTTQLWFQTQLERAKAERDRWKTQVKDAVKDSLATPTMPEAAVEPEAPQRRRLVVQDSTPEALGEILAGNPNGTLSLRDELAGWLMAFDRYSPGGREFWLEAYGGRPFVIDRKAAGSSVTIPFNGVSVLGGIQPEKLVDCLLSAADDGLVARFLWAWPDPIPYRRPSNIADVGKLEEVYRRLDGLCHAHDLAGKAKPTVLMLDENAASIFEAWQCENGASIQDAASLYKGFVGKLAGTVLRLSLVVEMLDWAASARELEPTRISAVSLVAAIEFIEEYAKPTALRVFGDAALPPAERNAAILARHIQKTGARSINGRDIRRTSGLPTLRQAYAVDEALEVLLEADWIAAAPSRDGETIGRQKKDFLVNPAVHGGER